VVVALFDTIDVGSTFRRTSWPAHVTLAPNFVVDAPFAELEDAVRGASVMTEPLTLEFGGRSLFGPRHDIPVQLVTSDHAVELHRRLADSLGSLRGFQPDVPEYWRHGHRPHLTLSARTAAVEGEQREVRLLAVVELRQREATIEAVIELSMVPTRIRVRR
jgi:2'-5' RNA ligase